MLRFFASGPIQRLSACKKATQNWVASPLERVMGIEPTSQPWEGRILPMNYTRIVGLL